MDHSLASEFEERQKGYERNMQSLIDTCSKSITAKSIDSAKSDLQLLKSTFAAYEGLSRTYSNSLNDPSKELLSRKRMERMRKSVSLAEERVSAFVDDVDAKDSASQVGSVSSIASSASNARVKAASKRVALQVKAAFLKKQHSLEYQMELDRIKMEMRMKEDEMKMRMKLEVLRIEAEISAAVAKEETIEKMMAGLHAPSFERFTREDSVYQSDYDADLDPNTTDDGESAGYPDVFTPEIPCHSKFSALDNHEDMVNFDADNNYEPENHMGNLTDSHLIGASLYPYTKLTPSDHVIRSCEETEDASPLPDTVAERALSIPDILLGHATTMEIGVTQGAVYIIKPECHVSAIVYESADCLESSSTRHHVIAKQQAFVQPTAMEYFKPLCTEIAQNSSSVSRKYTQSHEWENASVYIVDPWSFVSSEMCTQLMSSSSVGGITEIIHNANQHAVYTGIDLFQQRTFTNIEANNFSLTLDQSTCNIALQERISPNTLENCTLKEIVARDEGFLRNLSTELHTGWDSDSPNISADCIEYSCVQHSNVSIPFDCVNKFETNGLLEEVRLGEVYQPYGNELRSVTGAFHLDNEGSGVQLSVDCANMALRRNEASPMGVIACKQSSSHTKHGMGQTSDSKHHQYTDGGEIADYNSKICKESDSVKIYQAEFESNKVLTEQSSTLGGNTSNKIHGTVTTEDVLQHSSDATKLVSNMLKQCDGHAAKMKAHNSLQRFQHDSCRYFYHKVKASGDNMGAVIVSSGNSFYGYEALVKRDCASMCQIGSDLSVNHDSISNKQITTLQSDFMSDESSVLLRNTASALYVGSKMATVHVTDGQLSQMETEIGRKKMSMGDIARRACENRCHEAVSCGVTINIVSCASVNVISVLCTNGESELNEATEHFMGHERIEALHCPRLVLASHVVCRVLANEGIMNHSTMVDQKALRAPANELMCTVSILREIGTEACCEMAHAYESAGTLMTIIAPMKATHKENEAAGSRQFAVLFPNSDEFIFLPGAFNAKNPESTDEVEWCSLSEAKKVGGDLNGLREMALDRPEAEPISAENQVKNNGTPSTPISLQTINLDSSDMEAEMNAGRMVSSLARISDLPRSGAFPKSPIAKTQMEQQSKRLPVTQQSLSDAGPTYSFIAIDDILFSYSCDSIDWADNALAVSHCCIGAMVLMECAIKFSVPESDAVEIFTETECVKTKHLQGSVWGRFHGNLQQMIEAQHSFVNRNSILGLSNQEEEYFKNIFELSISMGGSINATCKVDVICEPMHLGETICTQLTILTHEYTNQLHEDMNEERHQEMMSVEEGCTHLTPYREKEFAYGRQSNFTKEAFIRKQAWSKETAYMDARGGGWANIGDVMGQTYTASVQEPDPFRQSEKVRNETGKYEMILSVLLAQVQEHSRMVRKCMKEVKDLRSQTNMSPLRSQPKKTQLGPSSTNKSEHQTFANKTANKTKKTMQLPFLVEPVLLMKKSLRNLARRSYRIFYGFYKEIEDCIETMQPYTMENLETMKFTIHR